MPMIEAMLAPIADDGPCGPDLEYDEDFLQLQQYAAGRPEEQYGTTVIAAQPPDWGRVEAIAANLFTRTKDLRVLVELARAWMRSCGLPGYADALRLAASLVSRYWDGVHPQLDIDGVHDPMPRINALVELVGPQGCARRARDCVLIGALTVKDVGEVLEGRENVADGGARYAGGRDSLAHELRTAFDAHDDNVCAAVDAHDALQTIRTTVRKHLGDEWSLERSAFERYLIAVKGVLDAMRPAVDVEAADATRTPDAVKAATNALPTSDRPRAPANGSAWREMQISSRADVDLGLEKMCRYFEEHEPSHPAPIFLRRAQRLLKLNFYEIIRDIAPDSLQQLDMLSGGGFEGAGTGAGEQRSTEST